MWKADSVMRVFTPKKIVHCISSKFPFIYSYTPCSLVTYARWVTRQTKIMLGDIISRLHDSQMWVLISYWYQRIWQLISMSYLLWRKDFKLDYADIKLIIASLLHPISITLISNWPGVVEYWFYLTSNTHQNRWKSLLYVD